ncbi:MAG: type VI secretion system baseplate subunit TssG [candidate division Zixibacteria bacterium]|nr:type VI secretion system baseplate subunit TssG [candidate division Zixibacteria bacterium]
MSARNENLMPDFCNRRNPFHYTTAINLLISKGVDPHLIDILAIGKYENYKGEVRSQIPEPGSVLRSETNIRLEIGFSSAVDLMPYQFFYGLHGRDAGGGWEENARHMMAPFDGAVIRYEAVMRYLTLKYNFGVMDEEYILQYLKLFDFDLNRETGSDTEAQLWAALMPIFNEWAGNPKNVEKVLKRVFGYRFKIVENAERTYKIPDSMRYHLGTKTGRLGHESILGKSFTERDSCYSIRILDIRQDEVEKFLSGAPLRKKLETVLELCMPSNLEYRISFITSGRGTKIGDKSTGAYLGYATRL